MKILGKRRRREQKTNYKKRRMLLEGKHPRVVLRKTNRYIIIQYVESEIAKDKVKKTITSRELLKYGWPKEKSGNLKNLAACYLTGLLFGKEIAKEKKEKLIVDIGLIRSTKGSRIYAAIKGIVESGVKIGHNNEMFPDEKRINSEKVKDFFEKVKNKISSGGEK